MRLNSKTPVEVTITKANANRLLDAFARPDVKHDEWRLFNVLVDQMDEQVGRYVVLTLSLKDAKAIHAFALRDIQRVMPTISQRCYGIIEKAFRDGYDARLRKMCGEAT